MREPFGARFRPGLRVVALSQRTRAGVRPTRGWEIGQGLGLGQMEAPRASESLREDLGGWVRDTGIPDGELRLVNDDDIDLGKRVDPS